MKKNFYTILTFLLASCSNNLQDQKKLNNRTELSDAGKSNKTEEQNQTQNDEESEVAAPAMVSGAFLTCSWSTVGEFKIQDAPAAAGCNILDENQKAIPKASISYEFEIYDNGKKLTSTKITEAEDKNWDIKIIPDQKFNYLSETIEIIAKPYVLSAELQTKMPPCQICRVLSTFETNIISMAHSQSNGLNFIDSSLKMTKLIDLSKSVTGDVQVYLANVTQAEADVKQNIATNDQQSSGTYQSQADLAQTESDRFHSILDEVSTPITNIQKEVTLVQETLSQMMPLHENIYKKIENLKCYGDMKTLEEYLKCTNNQTFLDQLSEIDELEKTYSEAMQEATKVVENSAKIASEYLVYDKNAPSKSVIQKNFLKIMGNYCHQDYSNLLIGLSQTVDWSNSEYRVSYCSTESKKNDCIL